MGFLAKLLGRDDDDSPIESKVISDPPMRAAVEGLAQALEDLARAMDTVDSPLGNPGWIGRIRDLRGAHKDLVLLTARPQFTKDELYDVLISVRPLYRGTAPADFVHLERWNAIVITRLDEVHQLG